MKTKNIMIAVKDLGTIEANITTSNKAIKELCDSLLKNENVIHVTVGETFTLPIEAPLEEPKKK